MDREAGKGWLEFGTTIDVDDIARDPTGSVARQESDHRGDIVGCCNPFDGLQSEREIMALLRFDEGGHVRGDDTRRNAIDPKALLPKLRRQLDD